MRIPAWAKNALARLSTKQGQWAMVGGVLGGGVFLLWAVFTATAKPPPPPKAPGTAMEASKVTNVGVMPGGAPVTPLDQWVGTAGKDVAILKQDRADQDRKNKDVDAFQKQVMERFGKLEETVRSQGNAAGSATPIVQAAPAGFPPNAALPTGNAVAAPKGPVANPAGMPPGGPAGLDAPGLVRVAVKEAPKAPPGTNNGAPATETKKPLEKSGTVDTYLPISFTRGIMLGGLDAPTGGQAQSNPHPIIIRLEDNAVLPNRFRSNVRECFVIAAGYGDIASERAYLRTETLSCVRNDGSTIEVGIAGVVYGEDGKVGVRGRLVTKQGQMLANALLAGLIGGLGQGLTSYNQTISTSSFGSVSTTSGNDAMRAGVGSGVGRAMDRLANYYIKLAEQTFPVVEVDAGRIVDVVITKGVKIEGGDPTKVEAAPAALTDGRDGGYYRTGANDEY